MGYLRPRHYTIRLRYSGRARYRIPRTLYRRLVRGGRRPRPTVRPQLLAENAVLRRAEERGQRVDGRILRIEPVRHQPREGIALTPEELAELASWITEHSKRLVLLAGTVGARQNEWFTLDEHQLELDGERAGDAGAFARSTSHDGRSRSR
jgi:hypothetical protein